MVLGICEDHLQPRIIAAAHLSEDVLGRSGVVYVRRRHDNGNQKTQGIYEDMALAALHLLAAIDSPLLAAQRGPDRLAVDCCRARGQRPPGLDAGQGTKDIKDFLPGAVRVPYLEVV